MINFRLLSVFAGCISGDGVVSGWDI